MRHLLLPVSFAAAVALAADPKDPAEVAREWNRTVEQAHQFPSPTSLAEHSLIPERLPLAEFFAADIPVPEVLRAPPLFRLNPEKKQPATPSDRMPPGAKPWRYRDQEFWLVPLVAGVGK